MDKRTICDKHTRDYTLLCKQCKKMICIECVEEHSEQGHVFILLSKYAAQVAIPEIDATIPILQSKDEAKALHDELASCLVRAKDRESKRQAVLDQPFGD